MSLLEASAIVKAYGTARVLDEATFSIEQGTNYGVVGINGSGKTTLLRILAGAESPDSGVIRIDGRAFRHLSFPSARALGIAYVAQSHVAIPGLSIDDLITLGTWRKFASPYGALFDEVSNLARAMTNDLRTHEHDPAVYYAALARAVIGKIRILLLDETASRLDSAGRVWLFNTLLPALNSSGVTCVVVSHDLEDIAKYCPTQLVVQGGTITRRDSATSESLRREIFAVPHVRADPAFTSRRAREGTNVMSLVQFQVDDGEPLDLAINGGCAYVCTATSLRSAAQLFDVICESKEQQAGRNLLFRDGARFETWSSGLLFRRGVRFVRSEPSFTLFRELSLLENFELLTVGEQTTNSRETSRIDQAARMSAQWDVPFTERANPVGWLSGGNQQKLAFALATSGDPKVVFGLTPFDSLDDTSLKNCLNQIARSMDRGVAFFFVLLDEDQAELLCHSLGAIRVGKLRNKDAGSPSNPSG